MFELPDLFNQEGTLTQCFFALPPLFVFTFALLDFSRRWLVLIAALSGGLSYACLMQEVQLIQLRIEREMELACATPIANQISAACEQAAYNYGSDTGRALAPFTGAVGALLYVALVLGFALAARRLTDLANCRQFEARWIQLFKRK